MEVICVRSEYVQFLTELIYTCTLQVLKLIRKLSKSHMTIPVSHEYVYDKTEVMYMYNSR